MSDQTIRTPSGVIISFDTTPSGKFILNIFGALTTSHIELSDSNMEELLELVGKTYYDATEEDSETFIKRLVKEAVAEALVEKDAADNLREYQKELARLSQPAPWYPPFPRPLVTY